MWTSIYVFRAADTVFVGVQDTAPDTSAPDPASLTLCTSVPRNVGRSMTSSLWCYPQPVQGRFLVIQLYDPRVGEMAHGWPLTLCEVEVFSRGKFFDSTIRSQSFSLNILTLSAVMSEWLRRRTPMAVDRTSSHTEAMEG